MVFNNYVNRCNYLYLTASNFNITIIAEAFIIACGIKPVLN